MSPTPTTLTTPAAPPRRAYARLRRKARAHPRLVDAVLAAGVLLCMLASSLTDPHHPDGPTWQAAPPGATGFTLMALGAAALVLRRRAPARCSPRPPPPRSRSWSPATRAPPS
ncbi:hypothetical protein ACFQVA_09165 [Actinomadura keratinilytica]